MGGVGIRRRPCFHPSLNSQERVKERQDVSRRHNGAKPGWSHALCGGVRAGHLPTTAGPPGPTPRTSVARAGLRAESAPVSGTAWLSTRIRFAAPRPCPPLPGGTATFSATPRGTEMRRHGGDPLTHAPQQSVSPENVRATPPGEGERHRPTSAPPPPTFLERRVGERPVVTRYPHTTT